MDFLNDFELKALQNHFKDNEDIAIFYEWENWLTLRIKSQYLDLAYDDCGNTLYEKKNLDWYIDYTNEMIEEFKEKGK